MYKGVPRMATVAWRQSKSPWTCFCPVRRSSSTRANPSNEESFPLIGSLCQGNSYRLLISQKLQTRRIDREGHCAFLRGMRQLILLYPTLLPMYLSGVSPGTAYASSAGARWSRSGSPSATGKSSGWSGYERFPSPVCSGPSQPTRDFPPPTHSPAAVWGCLSSSSTNKHLGLDGSVYSFLHTLLVTQASSTDTYENI